MGRKIVPNPPGANQSATRNAERAWKRDPIEPTTLASLKSGTLTSTITFGHPGLRPAELFTFAEFPGLLVMKHALKIPFQMELIAACLGDYTRLPNVTNLDTHYHIPKEGLWAQFQKDPNLTLELRETQTGEKENTGDQDISLDTFKPSDLTESPVKIDPPTSQRPYIKPVTVKDALKKLRWTSLGFQYYWKTKEYHLDRRVAMPELLESLTHAIIQATESQTGYPSNKWRSEAGIINFYRYKDSLTAHQDRSERNTEAPLISLRYLFAKIHTHQKANSSWPHTQSWQLWHFSNGDT
jgi:alkylated DNA repair protein alkB family protein 1